MQNTVRTVALIAALAGAAAYGWRWLFPGDEAQIHFALERIADGLRGDAASDFDRLARAASFRNHFAPEATVDPGPPLDSLRGREAIVATAAKVAGALRNLEVSLDDVTIQVDAARRVASANLTARAQFDDAGGGRSTDARELDIAFTRLAGEWVVASVTAVRPLRRLDQP